MFKKFLMNDVVTFSTPYGKITLPSNEEYIKRAFEIGSYWELKELEYVKNYIPKDKDIIEIGGHCGTSTIYYATHQNPDCAYYVWEPQKMLFDLLRRNIIQNAFQDRITAYNGVCFCCAGEMSMNSCTVDGQNKGKLLSTINMTDSINWGGLSLGTGGEKAMSYKLDDMKLGDRVGFIHCDAQGSESYIFYGAKDLIARNRPVILYENAALHGDYLAKTVAAAYPDHAHSSDFDVKRFCMDELRYSSFVDRVGGDGVNTLLIP